MVEISVQTKKTRYCAPLWHLIAGILMLFVGGFVWLNPEIGLIGLSLYLGGALIVIGAGYITTSIEEDVGWFTFAGVLDIIIGIILVANIGVTALTLPIIFGLWCLAVGAAQLVSAYKLSKAELPWGFSLALGILGLVFGFLILEYPLVGTIAISTLMGLYIVTYGLFEIGEYFYLKSQN